MPHAQPTQPSGCPARAVVRVADAPHLCQLQAATRTLCRSVGLDESSVFQAVIAVTELAHAAFIERSSSGSIELSALRRGAGLDLKAHALSSADGMMSPCVSMAFPLSPRYS